MARTEGQATMPFVSSAAEPIVHVGLSSWIIQDGNYGDLAVGDHAKFALEFAALDELRPATAGALAAEHRGASRHHVRARVVFVADGVCVIDAGSFLAFRDGLLDRATLGALVEGDVYVGIDPFFYFEDLHRLPNMPPLSYRWHVRAIQLETTPWREGTLPDGRPMLERDRARESFTAVTSTDAWHHDDGHGHYVLSCLREGGPEPP